VVIRAAVVLACVLSSAIARADDNASLVAARRAVEDVRYDDARRLLVEALRRGTSTAAELREIYRLSAATAQVLGQRDLAEQYYRRLLAIEPDATLPADASPKLRAPFVAAQAYMAAQGRLVLRAGRSSARGGGGKLAVAIVSDPLHMVSGVAAIADGAPLPAQTLSAAQPEVALDAPASVREVVALDEYGNALLSVAVEPAPDAAAAPPPPSVDEPRAPRTPLPLRWQTWAIPAGVLAGAGIGFAIDGRLAEGRLDDIVAADAMHFFDEAERERTRYRRSTIIADVSLAAAGVLAVTSAAVYLLRPASRAAVTARIDRGGGLVAVVGTF
jgi:hypothetical protein